ncbi:MAG: hypothetical protein D6695_01820 [Planctomycetota bacterium]|nr:MAG: hypothetical protein D6695_01820 [Planctomycetota bacterium]
MNHAQKRRVVSCLAALVMSTALLSEANAQSSRRSGQSGPGLTIPKPRGEPKPTTYTSILTALVIGGVVVVVTLLPSKRGHQD